jgi:choline dehydrogenase-like flavoprotein
VGYFEVDADIFIMAAGAVQTPVLLQRSGFKGKSGQIGKNFIAHPFIFPQALFKKKLDSFKGVPQAVYSFQFANFGQKENGSILLYGDFEGFIGTVFPMAGEGTNFSETLGKFRQMAQALVIINETAKGEITSSRSSYTINYDLTEHDRDTLARAARYAGEVFFSQGAEKYFVGNQEYNSIDDLKKITVESMASYRVNTIAAHPMSSCRMGKPGNSVVDSFGKIHELSNGYISDASILPESTGVNPQLTIMALASQVADRIINDLAKS